MYFTTTGLNFFPITLIYFDHKGFLKTGEFGIAENIRLIKIPYIKDGWVCFLF